MATSKTFCVIFANEEKRIHYENAIMSVIEDVMIYTGDSASQTLIKFPKEPPRVFISDAGMFDPAVMRTISEPRFASTALIALANGISSDLYLDDVVSGKLQILPPDTNDMEFTKALQKALHFSFEFGSAEFKLKHMKMGEILFNKGDKAEHVYILKKGFLRAFFPDKNETIGEVTSGEFVGEMAYFNGEPRLASVEAMVDSELIEIPIKNFEALMMQKPSWCKKLLQLLSTRLKEAIKPGQTTPQA